MAGRKDTVDIAAAAADMAKQPTLNMPAVDPIDQAEANRQERELAQRLAAMAGTIKPSDGAASGKADAGQGQAQKPATPVGEAAPSPIRQPHNKAQELAPLPVKRGRIFKPRKIVIYGPAGTGKTTLCADIPDVLFVDMDFGSEMLDVPRYIFRPGDNLRGHIPDSLTEFGRAIRAVKANPTGIGTLVVDGFTALERLAMLHICQRDAAAEGKEKLHSLESYGYGKGKQILLDQMRDVLAGLEALIPLGINVVIVAHSEVIRASNPQGADYDRYVIKALNHKDASVSSYTLGWADEVGFLHFDDSAGKVGKRGPIKGITGGSRLLEFDHSAWWDAKARLPLPRSVKVGTASPWSFMKEAIHRAYRMTPPEIRQEILDELTRIGDPELAVNVDKAVANVGDNLDRLTAFLQELRRRPPMVADDTGATSDEPI